MIPATIPHYALCNGTQGPMKDTHRHPIVAWDDDGCGLVLHPPSSRLTRAEDMAGFLEIVEDVAPVVAVIPGGGWLVEYGDPDGQGLHTSPVVGWAIRANGDAFAFESDEDGTFEVAAEPSGYRRVYHPDQSS